MGPPFPFDLFFVYRYSMIFCQGKMMVSLTAKHTLYIYMYIYNGSFCLKQTPMIISSFVKCCSQDHEEILVPSLLCSSHRTSEPKTAVSGKEMPVEFLCLHFWRHFAGVAKRSMSRRKLLSSSSKLQLLRASRNIYTFYWITLSL